MNPMLQDSKQTRICKKITANYSQLPEG